MDRRGYIICVDDEAGVLEALQEQLTGYFAKTHEVLTAISAEEAIELVDTLLGDGEIIEMIITDQVMPGMKGDEMLVTLQEKVPNAMKILLTGQAGLEATVNALNFGGLNRYVEKPWNRESLRRDIEQLIAKFQQNLENQYLLNSLEKRIEELTSDK